MIHKEILNLVFPVVMILSFSCGNTKIPKQNKTTYTNEIPSSLLNQKDTLLSFERYISHLPSRSLPYIEATEFDKIIDEDDLIEFDPIALRIEEVYPEFTSNKSAYMGISAYQIPLSTRFHSIVVTFKKGDYELETTLINYDSSGNIIDFQMVSYDQISEDPIRIESRISNDLITKNKIYWTEKKEVEQQEFRIHYDGIIDLISSKILNESIDNFPLILVVLEELELDLLEVKTDLIVSKELPDDYPKTAVLIPEISDIGEQYFELNSHVILVNSLSVAIESSYYEGFQTNKWVSDAIVLQEISIDTAPYRVTEGKRAFGVRVKYMGSSRVNPYSEETLSLFIQQEDSLSKILSNYSIKDFSGEMNSSCGGDFWTEEKILLFSENKSNHYFDIIVSNRITETHDQENNEGDCETKENISTQTYLLKFDGKEYKEEGRDQ